MIDVARRSFIRRWALREQMSIREIAKRTGLSRNTVRKYLRSETVVPLYAMTCPCRRAGTPNGALAPPCGRKRG